MSQDSGSSPESYLSLGNTNVNRIHMNYKALILVMIAVNCLMNFYKDSSHCGPL